MYKGEDRLRRRQQIERLDYPGFEIVEVPSHSSWSEELKNVSPSSELYVLWVDDDKPVTKNFLQEMTRPLYDGESSPATMHFWSGNALTTPRAVMTQTLAQQWAGEKLLMRLIMPVIDAVNAPNESISRSRPSKNSLRSTWIQSAVPPDTTRL
jgi:hypothetical protein